MHFHRRQGIAATIAVGVALTCGAAQAYVPDMIGWTETYRVTGGDTFVDIARRNGLGYVELVAANPRVDPWLPDVDTEIVLPTAHILPNAPRRDIVINLADMRLYYFPPDGEPPRSYPIGIGHGIDETPTGETAITAKRERPTWFPPESMRVKEPNLPIAIGPGPNNPLGDFALNLEWQNYVIHGTNRPYGIGRRVSHGCIRLYPDDIAELFAQVNVGTTVTVVDQPVKLGWFGGELYLEVHPTQRQADALERGLEITPERLPDIRQRIIEAADGQLARLDWTTIVRTVHGRRGVPTQITQRR